MLAGQAVLLGVRRWCATLVAVVGIAVVAGSARAVSIDYEVQPDMAASIWDQDPNPFFVTRDLTGDIRIGGPEPIGFTPGEQISFETFALQGTGSLCEGCGDISIDIVLNPSGSSNIILAGGPDGTGATGSLSLLIHLQGEGLPPAGVDIAAQTTALFPSGINQLSPDIFSAVYRFTSLEVLGEFEAECIEPRGGPSEPRELEGGRFETAPPEICNGRPPELEFALDLSNLRHLQFVGKSPVVPEPSTGLLLSSGLAALSLWRRRSA